MNTTGQSAETALPTAPLFASSWAALFQMLQIHFAQRPARDDAPARKPAGTH